MYHNHNKEVKAVNIMAGLTSYLDILSSSDSVLLLGHNIRNFDVLVLFQFSCITVEWNYGKKIVIQVHGFVDTSLEF